MPVTARLSRKFYDTFGDVVVNELVEWLNQVDATYRLELRELNDLNFARFDSKLEQRVTQLDAKIEQRTAELRAEFREGLATLEGRLLARMGVLEGRFGALEGRLIRWMFVFWAANVATVIALVQLMR